MPWVDDGDGEVIFAGAESGIFQADVRMWFNPTVDIQSNTHCPSIAESLGFRTENYTKNSHVSQFLPENIWSQKEDRTFLLDHSFWTVKSQALCRLQMPDTSVQIMSPSVEFSLISMCTSEVTVTGFSLTDPVKCGNNMDTSSKAQLFTLYQSTHTHAEKSPSPDTTMTFPFSLQLMHQKPFVGTNMDVDTELAHLPLNPVVGTSNRNHTALTAVSCIWESFT